MARPPAAHGTRSKYCSGCHCDLCRAANAKYQTERRWTLGIHRPASEKELAPCGTTAAYRRGCKCELCRRANANERNYYRLKRMVRTGSDRKKKANGT